MRQESSTFEVQVALVERYTRAVLASKENSRSPSLSQDQYDQRTRTEQVDRWQVMELLGPCADRAAASLHALQEWEGVVVEIGEKEFVALLIDVTGDVSHEDEEAVIPGVELSDGADEMLRVGRIFRWVIGYGRFSVGDTEAGLPDRLS